MNSCLSSHILHRPAESVPQVINPIEPSVEPILFGRRAFCIAKEEVDGYGTPAEQLEFGSLGPMGFSGLNEVSQLNDGSRISGAFEERFHGGTVQQSSPDQPSSPHVQR